MAGSVAVPVSRCMRSPCLLGSQACSHCSTATIDFVIAPTYLQAREGGVAEAAEGAGGGGRAQQASGR